MRTFTDEQQRAFAHGWPHLRVLGRAKSSKSPAQRAADVLGRVDPPASVAWTREVALAYLRGHAVRPGKVGPAVLETMGREAELDRAELVELVRAWARQTRYWFVLEHLVLVAEALLGPDATVDALCDWLGERERARAQARSLGATFGSARP